MASSAGIRSLDSHRGDPYTPSLARAAISVCLSTILAHSINIGSFGCQIISQQRSGCVRTRSASKINRSNRTRVRNSIKKLRGRDGRRCERAKDAFAGDSFDYRQSCAKRCAA